MDCFRFCFTSNNYYPATAYNQSKLAQVLFTKHLNNILREEGAHVQVHAVHPGVVDTDLFVHSSTTAVPGLKRIFFKVNLFDAPWIFCKIFFELTFSPITFHYQLNVMHGGIPICGCYRHRSKVHDAWSMLLLLQSWKAKAVLIWVIAWELRFIQLQQTTNVAKDCSNLAATYLISRNLAQ